MKKRSTLLLLLITVVILSGCVPKFKDSSEYSPPSWDVDVRVPLLKAESNFSESLGDNEDIVVNDDNVYSFNFEEDMPPFTLPPMEIMDTFSMDITPWTQGAITISNLTGAFSWDVPFIDTSGTTISESYTIDLASSSFDHITFSSDAMNDYDVEVVTDKQIDQLDLEMITTEADGTVHVIDKIELTNTTGATETLSLGAGTIYEDLKLRLTLQASNTGNLTFDLSPTGTDMEVVELYGATKDDSNLNIGGLGEGALDDIQPLKDLTISELIFKSGQLRMIESMGSAEGDFFDINLGLYLNNENIIDEDSSGQYIDLTGRTLSSDTAISASLGLSSSSLNYDVWDNNTQEIVPYSYELSFEQKDIAVKTVSGKIDDIMADDDPDTPGWQYTLEGQDTDIMAMDYPGDITDFDIGLYGFMINMILDNDTDFGGDLKLALNTYDSDTESAQIKKSANLDFSIDPRKEFQLKNVDGYEAFNDKMVEIVNSLPEYIGFSFNGAFTTDTPTITINASDYIDPKIKGSIPIGFIVKPGGAYLNEVITQENKSSSDEIDTIEQISNNVKSASLKINYANNSTIAFHAIANFIPKNNDLAPYQIDFKIMAENLQGKTNLEVNDKLFKILSDPQGYTFSVDLGIPNESSKDLKLSLKTTDNIKMTTYLDGTVNTKVQN